jgi:hypothetical protein
MGQKFYDTISKSFFCLLGEPFTKWRNYLDFVINVINRHNETKFKSHNQMLISYFTSPTTIIPQSWSKLYKYKIGDKVTIDALPSQRRDLAFKYSLNKGNTIFL